MDFNNMINGNNMHSDQQQLQQQSTPKHNNTHKSHRNKTSDQRKMVDITRDKPIRVAIRVVVPVRDHPKFNFVGKLLGPKGNSLKRLQEDTMCKMAVLGRGSMRDRHKEEELRASGDPKFQHLSEDLHVEISAFATPAEAHARIAYALAEVRRFLVPDYNDDIRQEQMWEMKILSNQKNIVDICQQQQTSNILNDQQPHSILHHQQQQEQLCQTIVSANGVTPQNTQIFPTQMLQLQQLSTSNQQLQNNNNNNNNGELTQHQMLMQQQQQQQQQQQCNEHLIEQQQLINNHHLNTSTTLTSTTATMNNNNNNNNEAYHNNIKNEQMNNDLVTIESTMLQQQQLVQHNGVCNNVQQQMLNQQQLIQQRTTNNCSTQMNGTNDEQLQNGQQHPAIRGIGGTSTLLNGTILTTTNNSQQQQTQQGITTNGNGSCNGSPNNNNNNSSNNVCNGSNGGSTGQLIHHNHNNNGTTTVPTTNITTNNSVVPATVVPVNGTGIISPSQANGIIAPIAINVNQGGVIGRKRPLMVGGTRTSMTPTKRTVMSLLARARAAQAKQLPATFQRAAAAGTERTTTLVPLLSEEYITNAVNLNIV